MNVKRLLKKMKQTVHGHTLLELVLAITIVLSLTPLIFAVYLSLFKAFTVYTKKSNSDLHSILVKKKIDSYLTNIGTVTGAYRTTLEYYDKKTNKKQVLLYRDSKLYLDKAILLKQLRSMKFDVYESRSTSGASLLIWEAILKNGYWLGGAKEIFISK